VLSAAPNVGSNFARCALNYLAWPAGGHFISLSGKNDDEAIRDKSNHPDK
jgi:hypothetical protein